MGNKRILNITEIENGIKDLIFNLNDREFIIEFLNFYDIPKTSITRAKKKFDKGEPFVIKNKVYYTEIKGDVVSTIDEIEHKILAKKSIPRYIITNNFINIAALDTKTRETLNINIKELPSKADFFLAWNGIEKADYQSEHPADRKAAERFARLYDVLIKDNPNSSEHAFNLFIIRVLFLLFAEDTGIMKKGIFTNTLKLRTAEDGSNLNEIIGDIFEILNTDYSNRLEQSNWLKEFKYVNGKLFEESHIPLIFTNISRKLLIEAGELLNWNEINPDILGSMIQSVTSSESRHSSGMHYTSVPNIMKVIKPLFLNELNNEFEQLNNKYEEIKDKNITFKTLQRNKKLILDSLGKLHTRISNIKFLDPACGSGNFLIITYKEIRRLEIKIILLEQKIEQSGQIPISLINLNQFNGIEIDDFAHEVAKISLWIAEHQMNEEMIKVLPSANVALLPLKDAGNIIHGNALNIDWNDIISCKTDDEIYIMGNPPYLGAKLQNKKQKSDLSLVLGNNINSKKVDFIIGWFYKGAQFLLNSNTKLAFVTTNSITQGEQVAKIWPSLLEMSQIHFAYTSFKWSNSAKNNAGVIVSIIGLAPKNQQIKKIIYNNDMKKTVKNITPYLVEGEDIFIEDKKNSISGFPKGVLGNLSLDGGHLILDEYQFKKAINEFPKLNKVIKKYVGSNELINDNMRFVIWMDKDSYNEFKSYSFIYERVMAVKKFRENGGQSARGVADKPYEFFTKSQRENAIKNHHEKYSNEMMTIVIPRVSSENRDYVPMGFVGEDKVISDSAIAIYGAPTWLLGVLESRMHMVWLRSIGGKLKTDFRYSVKLVYNNFPIQNLSVQRKKEIQRVILEILDIREYEGGSLADLYNKKNMPERLRKKHQELDGIIERAYQQKPFNNDEERLETLLKLYENMKNGDRNNDK